MPHAAQAERLVPAQRMVVVLQHWRAHLAELQPKAQLKSAKDGHQTCLDVFHLYYKDGFAKSYLTVVRLPFAPASCVTWPLASWPIYQVITCPRCPPMTLMLGYRRRTPSRRRRCVPGRFPGARCTWFSLEDGDISQGRAARSWGDLATAVEPGLTGVITR